MKSLIYTVAATAISVSAIIATPVSANDIIVDQFGFGNAVGDGQSGFENHLNFTQSGNGNLATGTQAGDNNITAVIQASENCAAQTDTVTDGLVNAVIQICR